ncbi:MAG: hypothetical protein HOA30_17465 [Rhodospirillaceae bacterium]|nr:hypothetical protein [Rhodospirillaceae bacterium]MBT5048678.1 hypothetical protein [Rhodospirillaceae bacterium]MBT5895053.1 hypothetical protein [Rhodospirillaceae bacterium]MBT6430532.1 hypothetical protein [Rhodospirillaceae bacterium]MBT6885829.1 hypothetical protein [Rhodospirillaceae bacterium]
MIADLDRCQTRLQEYVDAGATMFFVSTACPDEYTDTNLEMIAKTIIPAFRG